MTASMKPFPVLGPFKGQVNDAPSGQDPQAFDVTQNCVFSKTRVRSRPRAVQVLGVPPDGSRIRGMYSFLAITDSWHTLVLSEKQAYFLTNVAGVLQYNLLTLPSGITDLSGTNLPYSIVEMNQKVFFCNGSLPILFVDGSINVQLAGNVPGACLYLTENSSHLIGVHWSIPSPGIQGSTDYPFYVRMSDENNPLEWIPGIGNSAQVTNLIEKGGTLTGCQTLGTYTYVWRENGANVFWPTGQAAAPFYNDPFMWSNPGYGAFYPYTVATWNQTGYMVTHGGEVLKFNGAAGPSAGNFEPLADGKVKTRLSADLTNSTGDQVIGFVTDRLGPYFDFEAYVISVPGPNRLWVLELATQTWSTFTFNSRYATAFANLKVA